MVKSIFGAAHLVGYGTEAILTISAQPFKGYYILQILKILKNVNIDKKLAAEANMSEQ